MSLDFTDYQSTLVQVMAWCRQATSHYLNQCWPRSLSLYSVTRPQWVNFIQRSAPGSISKSCGWKSCQDTWPTCNANLGTSDVWAFYMMKSEDYVGVFRKIYQWFYVKGERFQWVNNAVHIDDLVQDCSNSSALAMELLQSCTAPSI